MTSCSVRINFERTYLILNIDASDGEVYIERKERVRNHLDI